MVQFWKIVDVNQESNGLRTESCGTPDLGFIWMDKKPLTLFGLGGQGSKCPPEDFC